MEVINEKRKGLSARSLPRYAFILCPFFILVTTALLLFTLNLPLFFFSLCAAFAYLLAAVGTKDCLFAAFFLQLATALLTPGFATLQSPWYLGLHAALAVSLMLTSLSMRELAASEAAPKQAVQKLDITLKEQQLLGQNQLLSQENSAQAFTIARLRKELAEQTINVVTPAQTALAEATVDYATNKAIREISGKLSQMTHQFEEKSIAHAQLRSKAYALETELIGLQKEADIAITDITTDLLTEQLWELYEENEIITSLSNELLELVSKQVGVDRPERRSMKKNTKKSK